MARGSLSLFAVIFALVYCRSKGQSVRLVGGSSSDGLLEVFENGEWGTVCDDLWGYNNAFVVCKELGFQSYETVFPSHTHVTSASEDIWYDDVECTGSESSLRECPKRPVGETNCGHFEDIGVACSQQTLRLVGGSSKNEGRIEVFHNRRWGTVCDDHWDETDALVVCKQLGYSSVVTADSHSFPIGTGKIWFDNVQCIGTEATLHDCPRSAVPHNCGHHEDVGIVCSSN
ncbi:neurotrypsin-like [Apostichopus japonicus]|uniref:neurotrypsin-like n=1 Tax=Stichopus japonicus TaxID=307972 RepID=UPI003AB6CC2A